MEATSFGGMLGFGPTLQLIECGFRSFLEVYLFCVRLSQTLITVVVVCCYALTPSGKEVDTNLGSVAASAVTLFHFGPDIRQDYPLNLSIFISGGKETNKDSPSNGE